MSDWIRFGAQRYERKRIIANLREWLRIFQERQSHIRLILDEQRIDCAPSPAHTTTVQGIGQVFNIYISRRRQHKT